MRHQIKMNYNMKFKMFQKGGRKQGRGKGKGKGGKGMPRWTAYLLWSTRKRREVVIDHPDWTFAQIAKWISDEWKKVCNN